jgi:hypothetical protein
MNHGDHNHDSRWNEHQWEAHLNDIEEQSAKLRQFITSDPVGSAPRWLHLINESDTVSEAVDTFVEEEMLLDEAYFPDEDEDELDDLDDELDEDDFLFGDSLDKEELGEDEHDGEEWKALSDDYSVGPSGSMDQLLVYSDARDMTIRAMTWAKTLPKQMPIIPAHEFIDQCLMMSAKLAGGYTFGYEESFIGANIAYTKKGLEAANDALRNLQILKKSGLFDSQEYASMHAQLFEVRNTIGIFVQELRDNSHFGIE